MLAHCLRDLIVATEENGTPWTVEAFARDLGVSGAHLHREFKKHCGLTPKSFGVSLKTGAHLRPSPICHEVQTEDPQSRDVLERGVIDNEAAPNCMEPQGSYAILEPPLLDDTGTEPFVNEDPSLRFLDILALEEFLHFDDNYVESQ